MVSLNSFMATTQAIMPPRTDEPAEPFDIEAYRATAAEVGRAAAQMNTLVTNFEGVFNSPGWEKVLPRLEKTINKVGDEGEELIDHGFKQSILLILIWLAGYIAARFILAKLARRPALPD
jgi:hypothetical protein